MSDIRAVGSWYELRDLISRMVPGEGRPSTYTEGAVDIDLLADGEVITEVTLIPQSDRWGNVSLCRWGDCPDCWLRGDAIQAVREVSDNDVERATLFDAIYTAAVEGGAKS